MRNSQALRLKLKSDNDGQRVIDILLQIVAYNRLGPSFFRREDMQNMMKEAAIVLDEITDVVQMHSDESIFPGHTELRNIRESFEALPLDQQKECVNYLTDLIKQ